MHFTLEDLDWASHTHGGRRAEVVLREGDTMDNPASTRHPIPGPRRLVLNEYPDGGIDAVEQPEA